MQRFLYVSPYFPPLRRAGALDPLKLVRAMPVRGWQPVVLADQWPGAALDPLLTEAVPEGVHVRRSFSGRAPARTGDAGEDLAAGGPGWLDSPLWPGWIARQEWLPLGDIGLYLGHALRQARALLYQHDCALIVAQSTPYASLVVGERLSRETGVPLVCVLGDPWTPCELKRGERPWHTRVIQERAETRVLRQASRYVLYTERAVQDYREKYPSLPADFFVPIHNGHDTELTSLPGEVSLPAPALLFFGSFSPHIRGEPLIELLAALKRRGGSASRAHLSLTSQPPPHLQRLAGQRGVEERIQVIGHQSYRRSAAVIDRASILVAINATAQRIVAKTYDYLPARRPILAISPPHPQLETMLAQTGAGRCFRPDDIAAMADFVEACLEDGDLPDWPRAAGALQELSFSRSADILARVFEEAMASAAPGRLNASKRSIQ